MARKPAPKDPLEPREHWDFLTENHHVLAEATCTRKTAAKLAQTLAIDSGNDYLDVFNKRTGKAFTVYADGLNL